MISINMKLTETQLRQIIREEMSVSSWSPNENNADIMKHLDTCVAQLQEFKDSEYVSKLGTRWDTEWPKSNKLLSALLDVCNKVDKLRGMYSAQIVK